MLSTGVSEELDSYSLTYNPARESALHLLQNAHSHIDIIKEVLATCLKEINGKSYLKRLSVHQDKNVRFYGILLTTALISRVNESGPLLKILQGYLSDESLIISSFANEVRKHLSPYNLNSSLSLRVSMSLPDYSVIPCDTFISPWFHGMCNTHEIESMKKSVDDLQKLLFKSIKRECIDDDYEISEHSKRVRI